MLSVQLFVQLCYELYNPPVILFSNKFLPFQSNFEANKKTRSQESLYTSSSCFIIKEMINILQVSILNNQAYMKHLYMETIPCMTRSKTYNNLESIF